MPRRVDQYDVVNYLDKWGTCYLEICLVIYTRQSCGNLLPPFGRDPARVAAKYDFGYSGPMNGNGSVRGRAWRNHCKDFVHARVRFRRK